MLTLLLPSLLLCPAVHAGTWQLQITSGSGTATATHKPTRTWTAPVPATTATNTVTIPSLSNGQSANAGGGTATASANLSVTITGTWQADTSLPSDPAPPKVLVYESSTAFANDTTSDASGNPTPAVPGTADDGLGQSDPVDPSIQPVGTVHGTKYDPKSGGTFTVTLSLQSKAIGTVGPSGTNPNGLSFIGTGTCQVGVGPVTISIHAQPYNFRSSGYDMNGVHYNKSVQDNPDATLALSYIWSSTDGNSAHLTTCMIKENVTWDSNSTGVGMTGANPDGAKYYAPPSPPVGTNSQGQPLAYPNPTVTQQPATNPGITDTFSPDGAYVGPYKAISWWGDQTYVFSDSATGESMAPLTGPAAGTFRITRTVAPTGIPSGTTGTLTISTRGYSAGPESLQ